MLPDINKRRHYRTEEYELINGDGPLDACQSQKVAFLLGYTILTSGFGLYMCFAAGGLTLWYYFCTVFFSLVGIAGIVFVKPVMIFVYNTYLIANFMLASVGGITSILFVMPHDVCSNLNHVIPNQDVVAFCRTNTNLFRTAAIGSILVELMIEIFVIHQLTSFYKASISASHHCKEAKRLPKGKLGSISIVEP